MELALIAAAAGLRHGAAMEEPSFVVTALVFLVAAVVAVPLANQLGLGAVLGFLVAGIVIGPDGAALITDAEDTLRIAELGVVFLLFLLGLELSPQRLWVMRRIVFGAGGLQLSLTALVIGLIALMVMPDWRGALVMGLALAQSSTAVALQVLAERKEVGAEHGNQAFGISLFQDVTAIPILALLPVLGAAAGGAAGGFSAMGFGKALAVIAAVILVGRAVLPPLFQAISRAGSVEVFSAAALLVVMGTAWIMQQAGLSVTLGAFIAGVLLANSEFRHEIESHIQPFKGLLLGLFFIAVGMQIDLDLIEKYPLLIAGCVLAVFAVKMPILFLAGRAVGRLPVKPAMLLAGLLGAAGEFGFVVLTEGHRVGLVDAHAYGIALVVIGLSMALTPLVVRAVDRLVKVKAKDADRPFDAMPDEHPRVIIAGFGRVGQIVARVLAAQGIAHTVLEPSVEQVDFSRRFGSKLYYGDPSRPELLRAARCDQAELFIVAIEDLELNVRTARVVRRMYPQLRVLARARNRQHAFKLMDLGVEYLVRETFHSSLELTRQTLVRLGLSERVADERVERFREHDERMLAEQHLIYDDETALIQSAAEARAELDRIFAADREATGKGDEAG
jgi:glutathione-regulated potassium-efflux system protein KefB